MDSCTDCRSTSETNSPALVAGLLKFRIECHSLTVSKTALTAVSVRKLFMPTHKVL